MKRIVREIVIRTAQAVGVLIAFTVGLVGSVWILQGAEHALWRLPLAGVNLIICAGAIATICRLGDD